MGSISCYRDVERVNEEQQFRLDWTNNLCSLIHLPCLVIRRRTRASVDDSDNDDGDNGDDDIIYTMYAIHVMNVIILQCILYEQKKLWLNPQTHARTQHTIYIVSRKERNYSYIFFFNHRQRFKIQTRTHQMYYMDFQHDEYNLIIDSLN